MFGGTASQAVIPVGRQSVPAKLIAAERAILLALLRLWAVIGGAGGAVCHAISHEAGFLMLTP